MTRQAGPAPAPPSRTRPGGGSPCSIDWYVDGSFDAKVFGDVSGDGQCDVLHGFNDWETLTPAPAPGVTKLTHMSTSLQCQTGNFAD